jgi:AraC-like DNA-binding protein
MENLKGPETVLVTGGSGFIASYYIIELLRKGYKVRASLRSLNRVLKKFSYLTGRSLTTFKKDFKNFFHTTPGRWLIKKRLERAHYQIVVQKQKPVNVYLDAGFENLAHFSFAFKRQFGYNVSQIPAE